MLRSISIPNSVSTIGLQAFSGCIRLKNITLPPNVKELDGTFLQCEALVNIDIPYGVIKLRNTFVDCNSLTEIVLPNSITTIEGAFTRCSKLSSVKMSESLISIGAYAFKGCTNITQIEIPLSANIIEVSAFEECTGLTSVSVPKNITSIGSSAFYSCNNLVTVTIGEGIKTIEKTAFSYCPELMDVYCYAVNIPATSSNVFDNSYIEYATLHVPEVAYESYRTTEPWSNFGTIKVLDGETPVVEKCATPTITYANGKVKFACETEGVEFVPSITVTPNQLQNGNELAVGGTFTVSVYAVKEGYDNSDTATMTINMSQMGDVNADGELNAADITAVVNAILGK